MATRRDGFVRLRLRDGISLRRFKVGVLHQIATLQIENVFSHFSAVGRSLFGDQLCIHILRNCRRRRPRSKSNAENVVWGRAATIP